MIKVDSIKPRFGRRSGGTIITVAGQNFGFAGAEAIVRVNGVPCQKSYHLTTAGAQGVGVRGPNQESNVYCITPYGEGTELSVTVEAPSGPTDSPYNIRMPSNRKGWQSFETTSESCINEVNRGFTYAGHDWAWATFVEQPFAFVGTTTMSVAVDDNSGNIYIAGRLAGAGVSVIVEKGAAPVQEQNRISCRNTAMVSCGYLVELNPAGKFLWFATVETASSATATAITSISVDSTGMDSQPMIYFSGWLTAAATSNIPLNIVGVPVAVVPSAQNVGASTNVQNFIGKIDGAGTGKWIRTIYRCSGTATAFSACETAGHAGESFSQAPLISTYRASTSHIINQHTKGDAPSNDYILGTPRDNGGVYVATTIYCTNADFWTPTGDINVDYKPTGVPANSEYAQVGRCTAAGAINVLIKYDSLGNSQWARQMQDFSTVTTSATHFVTALVAQNDAVYVSHRAARTTANASPGYYDTCAWSTKTSGLGSTNPYCNSANRPANAQDFATDSVTVAAINFASASSRVISFLAAYSAAGVLKWSKEIIPSSFQLVGGGVS